MEFAVVVGKGNNWEATMKLDVKAFALTCAVIWSAALALGTWWVMAFGAPTPNPTWISFFYRGYSLTLSGSLVGAAWAFVDGLVGGAVFAWLYNRIDDRFVVVRRMAA